MPIIMRCGGGGGINNDFAVIIVTFTPGSVCTCTKGTKTLKAKDTSGKWLFAVPESGAWIVETTNGTETASTTVIISNQYQVEYIKIYYKSYLYYVGDEMTEITGGWTANGYTYTQESQPSIQQAVKNADNVYAYYGNQITHVLGTANVIDMTGYTKIKVDCKADVTDTYGVCVHVLKQKRLNAADRVLTIRQNSAARGIIEGDISNISSGYVCIDPDWTGNKAGNVYRIWLE